LTNASTANSYGLAFYNRNKEFISFVPSKTGSNTGVVYTEVEVPAGACYFKASFFGYENRVKYGEFACDLIFSADTIKNGKRPYQDGYIFFSQKVDQSILKYWETDESVKHNSVYKATTGVLALPTTYTQTGKKTPLLVYAHGLSHYVYYGAWGNTDTFREQKQHWLDMGFAVMDCNGARDKKGGNFPTGICPQGVNAYRQCVEYVIKNYNVDSDIYLVAGSAGGALGWNYLSMYGDDVRAAVFISAWADLEYNAWTNGGAKSLFTEFLGFNNTTTYEVEKTIGYDQKLRIVTIGNKDYCFNPTNTPIYALCGATETTLVQPMKKTISAMRNAGFDARLRVIDGCGHEIVSGANTVVDTEIGNWLLSHHSSDYGVYVDEPVDPTVYYIITYNYIDENGNTIQTSTTETVKEGTTKSFSTAPQISGYDFVSVSPTSATITSNLTVTYTYKKIEEPEPEPDEPEVDENDLTQLFNFTPSSMAVKAGENTVQFKSSSYFMSCFTDMSDYVGSTIELMVPQYTASNGASSTGRTFWHTTGSKTNTSIYELIKEWDTHDAGNSTGILVPIQTVVPAEAPYLWTSTYMPDATAYVGPNDGVTDFYCKIVSGTDEPDEPDVPDVPVEPDEEGWVDLTDTIEFTPSTVNVLCSTTHVGTTYDHFLNNQNFLQMNEIDSTQSTYFRTATVDMTPYRGKEVKIMVPIYKNA
jgi:pimeloyl-ACP methyl ester carboxylesterase